MKPLQRDSSDNDFCNPKLTHHAARVQRRSIPEFDAYNPTYTDLDHEVPVEPQGDISHFALADQVGNFFRSHKVSAKSPQKAHMKAVQGERPVNLVKETESVYSNDLPMDEQEECYRQQNLAPPAGKAQKSLTEQWQAAEGYPVPAIDLPQGLQSSYVRSEVVKERPGQHFIETSELDEVSSLYSDPEKVKAIKKVKNFPAPKTPDRYNVPLDRKYENSFRVHKVPKQSYPVNNIQAPFPVYDEDINFPPDPLQGILDDKYWLDPQEEEIVVKKSNDLAVDGVLTSDFNIQKRSLVGNENKIKTGETKVSFKETNNKCPCKEVVACGECGKNRKNNCSSFSNGEVITYNDGAYNSRKLLFLNYDQAIVGLNNHFNNEDVEKCEGPTSDGGEETQHERNDEKDSEEYVNDDSNDETQIEDEIPNLSASYVGRKLLSHEDGFTEAELNPNLLGKNSFDSTENQIKYITRRVLWYYDGNEESYNEELMDNEDDPQHNFEYERPFYSKGSLDGDIEKTDNGMESEALVNILNKEDNGVSVHGSKPLDSDALNLESIEYHTKNLISPSNPLSSLKMKDGLQIVKNNLESGFTEVLNGNIDGKALDHIQNRSLKINNRNIENIGLVGQVKLTKDNSEVKVVDKSEYKMIELKNKNGGQSSKTEAKVLNKRHLEDLLNGNSKINSISYVTNKVQQGGLLSLDNEHFEKNTAPVNYLANKDPGIYVPNKMQNILQKVLQEKPHPVSSTSTEDPDVAFEIAQNETFHDASTVEYETSPIITLSPETMQDKENTVKFSSNPEKRHIHASKDKRAFGGTSVLKSIDDDPSVTNAGPINMDSSTQPSQTSTIYVSQLSTSANNVATGSDKANKATTPNITTYGMNRTTKQAGPKVWDDEEKLDAQVANDIVETVISESEKSQVLGNSLGVCRRNESVANMQYGRVIPETEKVLKIVTNCILDRLKSHLAKQACILLDSELLDFLKWIVLSGDSYKEYMQKLGPKFYDFVPPTEVPAVTCEVPTTLPLCQPETPPPNPSLMKS